MTIVKQKSGINHTTFLAVTSMLAALAAGLMFIEFPLPFIAPSFYEFDFSEDTPVSHVILSTIENFNNDDYQVKVKKEMFKVELNNNFEYDMLKQSKKNNKTHEHTLKKRNKYERVRQTHPIQTIQTCTPR